MASSPIEGEESLILTTRTQIYEDPVGFRGLWGWDQGNYRWSPGEIAPTESVERVDRQIHLSRVFGGLVALKHFIPQDEGFLIRFDAHSDRLSLHRDDLDLDIISDSNFFSRLSSDHEHGNSFVHHCERNQFFTKLV